MPAAITPKEAVLGKFDPYNQKVQEVARIINSELKKLYDGRNEVLVTFQEHLPDGVIDQVCRMFRLAAWCIVIRKMIDTDDGKSSVTFRLWSERSPFDA
jgi:hypothetical protein